MLLLLWRRPVASAQGGFWTAATFQTLLKGDLGTHKHHLAFILTPCSLRLPLPTDPPGRGKPQGTAESC